MGVVVTGGGESVGGATTAESGFKAWLNRSDTDEGDSAEAEKARTNISNAVTRIVNFLFI